MVAAGQILSIVGPSGSGKSTLLRIIAGLESPQSGSLSVGNGQGCRGHRLGFLFQDYDAYPWHTVWDNVKVGSGPAPYPDDTVVSAILSEVGLIQEKDRYPAELSGGMRKRLGLARAVVRRPSILLLDEPFSSLDIDTRYDMYRLLQRLWRESGCAIVIVTHDLHEAILLADNVAVLPRNSGGQLETIPIPFAHPRDERVEDLPGYALVRQHITQALVA